MSMETPPSPREELEARLTALLLGELSTEEEGALCAAMENDASLAQLHDRLSRTMGLVREAAGSLDEVVVTPAPPLQISPERRARLLGAFKVTRPAAFGSKALRRHRFVSRELASIAAMVVALFILAGVALTLSQWRRLNSMVALSVMPSRLVDESLSGSSLMRRAVSTDVPADGDKFYFDLNRNPDHDLPALTAPAVELSVAQQAVEESRRSTIQSLAIALPPTEPALGFGVEKLVETPAPPSAPPPVVAAGGGRATELALGIQDLTRNPAPVAAPESSVRSFVAVAGSGPAQNDATPASPASDELKRLNEAAPDGQQSFQSRLGRIANRAATAAGEALVADTDGLNVSGPRPMAAPVPPPVASFAETRNGLVPVDKNTNGANAPSDNSEWFSYAKGAEVAQVQSAPAKPAGASATEEKKKESGVVAGTVALEFTPPVGPPAAQAPALEVKGYAFVAPASPSTGLQGVEAAYGLPKESKAAKVDDKTRAPADAGVRLSGSGMEGRGLAEIDRTVVTLGDAIQPPPVQNAQPVPTIPAPSNLAKSQMRADDSQANDPNAFEMDVAGYAFGSTRERGTAAGRIQVALPQLGEADASQKLESLERPVLLTGVAGKAVDQLVELGRQEDQLHRSTASTGTLDSETLRKLEGERITAGAELARIDSMIVALTNYSPAELKRAMATASPDPVLGRLLTEQSLEEKRLADLTNDSGFSRSEVEASRRRIAAVSRQVDERLEGILDDLKVRAQDTKARLESANSEVERARTQEELSRPKKELAPDKTDAAIRKAPATAPVPQPEVQTAGNPFSTFSLNVSDVSFKLSAAALEKDVMPDPATVRSEEFINAFDYRDPEPPPGVPVAFAWERARYPFAHNRDLLRFSIKTAASGRQTGRPLNLVLLLDNSGSMERADRMRIIQECLRALGGQLQPQDRVSVVAFARTPRLWVDGLPGNQAGELAQRVGGLTPQGGTNLEDAMNLAYQTASRHFLANGVNRVVLLTDGAANLGDVEPDSLKKKVETQRQQGVALDCFGIGWEGFKDELLETLSRNGDGRYGFVNSPEAAAKEFAGQLAGALQVAASDVKVQVEFNPRRVTSYRQIGYAKHQLKKEEFRDNTVDAAEIAAAEAGNALYTVEVNPSGEGPLATVRVRFKVPGTTDYREHEWPVAYEGAAKTLEQSSAALRLAGAASAFSEWLVVSPFAGDVTPDRLLSLLTGVPEKYGADPRPKKLEWMVRQAKILAGR